MTPDAGPPADLLAAFEAYERALMADDLDALDAAFAPGTATLRGDAAGLLVGHDLISGFRGSRGGVPPREITRLETRVLSPDAVLLVSVSRYRAGGQGLQTQLWQRLDGAWKITAAHVTGRSTAFDRSIWRMVGDPHFAQGDGEVALTALEAPLRATVRFDLVKRADALAEFGEVLGPLGRTSEYLLPTGLDADLDEAMRDCVRQALSLIRARWGLDEHLAYAYLSAATDFRISQVVDLVCGVHACIREADFDRVER